MQERNYEYELTSYQRKPASVKVQVWRRALTSGASPELPPHSLPTISTNWAALAFAIKL
jgi:hypothetical protein